MSDALPVSAGLRTIWHRRRMVLAACAVCAAAALAVSALMPTTYASAATVSLGDVTADHLEYRALLREPGMPERLLAAQGAPASGDATLRVNLQRHADGAWLVLTVHAAQADHAARGANVLAGWLVDSVRRKSAEAAAARARAEHRLEAARQALEAAQIASRLDTTEADLNGWLALVASIPELRVRIQGERARLALLEQQLGQLDAAPGVSPVASREDHPSGRADARTPHPLREHLERDVLAVRSEIAALEGQYQTLRGLSGQHTTWHQRLEAANARRTATARLERQLREAQSAYDELAGRRERSEAGDESPPRILTAADVPRDPVSPRPLANMAIAAFVGFVFACAAALVAPAPRTPPDGAA